MLLFYLTVISSLSVRKTCVDALPAHPILYLWCDIDWLTAKKGVTMWSQLL